MAYELEDELEGLPELEDEFEGELEDELEDEGEEEFSLGSLVGGLLGEEELEGEDEFEDEGEFEDEYEEEVNPQNKIYPDAMMEHLGELASEAESEDEAAEHFGPLVKMAAAKLLPVIGRAVAPAARRMLPKVVRAVTRASPQLTRSIRTVARALHRNPQTRRLLKVVPAIARRTVGSIARQAAHGRHITPRLAIRTLARNAKRVLGHPHHRRHALRRHHHLERKFHHLHGRGIAHRHHGVRHVRRGYGYRPGVRTVGGVHYRHGVAGPHVRRVGGGLAPIAHGGGGYRPGRIVGGRHVCPPCPSCGGTGSSPRVCRCCGHVLR